MTTLYKIIVLSVLLSAAGVVYGQAGDRDSGIALYNEGSYKEAVGRLEKAVKTNADDAAAQTYLALALIETGAIRAAEKHLGKSLALDADQMNARKALAYVYLLRGKTDEAIVQAESVIAAGAPDAEVFYILGSAKLRRGEAAAALENAEKALLRNPKMSNAYLLRAQARLSDKNPAPDFRARAEKYGTAADDLKKFVDLKPDLPNAEFWRGQERTLRTFADYYAGKTGGAADAGEVTTPLKIVSKRPGSYTDAARQNGISGRIVLLVAFGADGKVGGILILRGLGYGLDEEAVSAAKAIKFAPETRAGKPVTAVRPIEYAFSIY
jgi:periplasmic protein TonB